MQALLVWALLAAEDGRELQHVADARLGDRAPVTMTSMLSLASRAEALRQSLDSSHEISQEACRVLDQYCSQLSDLERIVHPVVFKTQALTQTRENVKQARAKAEEVLDHLDASRKVLSKGFTVSMA